MNRLRTKRGYRMIGEFLALSSGFATIPIIVATLSWSLH
jgi:hypothetical protein